MTAIIDLGKRFDPDITKRRKPDASGGDWRAWNAANPGHNPKGADGRWRSAGAMVSELMDVLQRHRGSEPDLLIAKLSEQVERTAHEAGLRSATRRGDLVRFDPAVHQISGRKPKPGTMVEVDAPGFDVPQWRMEGLDEPAEGKLRLVNVVPARVRRSSSAQEHDFDAKPKRATARLKGPERHDPTALAVLLQGRSPQDAADKIDELGLNLADLRDLASRMKVSGRSKMRKAELRDAIAGLVGVPDRPAAKDKPRTRTPRTKAEKVPFRDREEVLFDDATYERAERLKKLPATSEGIAQAKAEVAGLSNADLKELAAALGQPAIHSTRTKKQLQEHVVGVAVGNRAKWDAIAGMPSESLWGRIDEAQARSRSRAGGDAASSLRHRPVAGGAAGPSGAGVLGPAGAGGQDAGRRGKSVSPESFRAAYDELAAAPGEWVSIADLRARFPDVPREDMDALLRDLEQRPDVNIVPQANEKALSDRSRQAAVTIGRQPKHFIAMGLDDDDEAPTRGSAAPTPSAPPSATAPPRSLKQIARDLDGDAFDTFREVANAIQDARNLAQLKAILEGLESGQEGRGLASDVIEALKRQARITMADLRHLRQ